MSAINEAYRVLADPGRRALYDRELAGGRLARSVDHDDVGDGDDRDDVDGGQPPDGAPRVRHSALSPDGPARVPWRLMAITAVVGSAVILVASTFDDPPSEEVPDGILRPGSCVLIEANTDVREVACTGDGDIEVELLIPTDARCPAGMVAHRDRLGLGTVCIGA
jgi:molecular chaperone DnaJ